MQEIYNLEIDDDTLSTMLEMNPEIKELTSNEVLNKINLLKIINCSNRQITNIISSNSIYLSRMDDDIKKLISYLLSVGFKSLNILFFSPFKSSSELAIASNNFSSKHSYVSKYKPLFIPKIISI